MAEVKQRPGSDPRVGSDRPATTAPTTAPPRRTPAPRRTAWMAWAAVIVVLAASVTLAVVFVGSDGTTPAVGSDGYVAFDPATIENRVPQGYAPSGWEPASIEGYVLFDPATIESRVPVGFYPVQMRMTEGFVVFEPGTVEPRVPEGFAPSGWEPSRLEGFVVFDPATIRPRVPEGFVPQTAQD